MLLRETFKPLYTRMYVTEVTYVYVKLRNYCMYVLMWKYVAKMCFTNDVCLLLLLLCLVDLNRWIQSV